MNEKEKKKEECFSYMTGESLHLELHQLCSVVFADDMMNLCNFAEVTNLTLTDHHQSKFCEGCITTSASSIT